MFFGLGLVKGTFLGLGTGIIIGLAIKKACKSNNKNQNLNEEINKNQKKWGSWKMTFCFVFCVDNFSIHQCEGDPTLHRYCLR